MPPLLGGSSWGLPSRVEYLSPQAVLLPLVYGTIASPLWLELWGLAAWQATPSWTVYRLACHRLLPWLRVTFALVPDAVPPASDHGLGVPPLLLAQWVGWVAPLRPTQGVWFVVARPSAALGAHACAVSWATWLLFIGVSARCVALHVRCPGPLASCSLVYSLGALCCVCGVLGPLAPVHCCARSVRCVVCAVSWATWPLFTCVPARCVVLRVWCPGPLCSCSPLCSLSALRCVCGVLGDLAPIHRCARSVCCVACVVSWATSLLFTAVLAQCVVLRVRSRPLGSSSLVCSLGVLCCVCGILGHLAPVHQCAHSVRYAVCAVSWAAWLLCSGVLARRVVLRARRPRPLGSCAPVCSLGVLCCLRSVLCHLAPVHRCVRSVCCAVCCVCGVACAGRCCGAHTRPSGRRLFVADRG